MKTSVIEIRDVLSVLSAQQVEKRMADVPGVASVTVNDAAGNATVRYDEARVEIAAIKASVHRHGPPSASRALPKHPKEHKKEAPNAPLAATAPGTSEESARKDGAAPPAPVVTAVAGAPPPAAESHTDHPAPDAPTAKPPPSTPTPAVEPATATSAQAATAADLHAGPDVSHTAMGSTPPAGPSSPADAPAAGGHKEHQGHTMRGDAPAMSADMAHEMGHDGMDLPAMVRDMRNRFWICLVFTVPIFIYAPMGGMFKPPAPPFGLELNLWLFFFSSAAEIGRAHV